MFLRWRLVQRKSYDCYVKVFIFQPLEDTFVFCPANIQDSKTVDWLIDPLIVSAPKHQMYHHLLTDSHPHFLFPLLQLTRLLSGLRVKWLESDSQIIIWRSEEHRPGPDLLLSRLLDDYNIRDSGYESSPALILTSCPCGWLCVCWQPSTLIRHL